MAGEVQLKLGIGLDLNFFRQEMRKAVNIAQSEFTANLAVKIDRRRLDSELNNLQRAIKRRTYRIEIGGNLDRLPDQIDKLRFQLQSLEATKIDVGIGVVKSLSKRDASAIKKDLRNQVLGEDKKIFVPASIKPSITNRDVQDFQNAVKSKLSGITVKIKADLEAASIRGGAKTQAEIDADVARGLKTISEIGAARMAGGAGITESARREQLKQSLTSGGFDIAQLKQIGSQLGVGGVGRFRNAENLINKIVAEASIEMVKKYLDPQAVMRNSDRSGLQRVLDTFARGVFNMLGMDAASMMAAQRQKRLPPAIDFPATIPPKNIQIGPSGTGRSLTGAPPLIGLPGTSFGSQKRLIGDILDPELKEILRGAANAFVDNIRAQLNSAVRSVSVRDLGTSIRGAISGGEVRTPLMLPAAGGTGGYFTGGRRPGGGFVPEGGFPSDGPIAQSSPLAQKLPAGYLELGKMSSALREADKYLKQAKVPLAGAIQELGGEFGYAVQQVLLFGTAYKALAFFMDLPRQAFDASKALQTFNNQLNALTGSAAAADRASSFVSSVVDQFSVPLESARQGFVKLYASMEPAGIPTQTIEGLFVGVSKAAATLGLSADQVDRVNYAFSQMASKGQIMSEEVSGQLGDVIPGALSIMAEAAGLSLSEFKVAMEKGQLSGKALEQVFANLSIVLEDRFGAGAQGAADTLQGVVNQMSTAMTRLYESFEPIVAAGVKAFGPDIIQLITDATSAVQAFGAAMAGNSGPANMLSQNARSIYEVLSQVTEIGKALANIIQQLSPTFLTLGNIILTTLEYLAKFINTPIGSFLANWAAQAGIAALAMQLLAKTGIISAATALIDLIRQLITGRLTLERLALAAGAAKFSLMGLGATAIFAGLTMLVSHLNSVYQKMLDIQNAAKNAQQSIAAMSQTQATVLARQTENQIAMLKKFQQQSKGLGGLVSASGAEVTAMAAAGGTPGVAFTGRLVDPKTGTYGTGTIDPTQVEAAIQKLEQNLAAARLQARPVNVQSQIQPVQLSAGKDKDGAGRKPKKTPLQQILDNESRRKAEMRASDMELHLARKITQARKAGNNEEADSLENLKQAVKLRGELAELQAYQKMLIDKESEIVGKSLTQQEYNNKLQDANVAVYKKDNEIKQAYLVLQEKENKKIQDRARDQKDFLRDLEDIRIENGLIPEEQAKQIKLARQYEDIIQKYPFLTEQQKLALRAAIYAQAEDTNALAQKIKELKKELQNLASTQTMVKTGAEAIGSSFAQSFKDVISGAQTAQQAMANFFQRIADSFLDMAAQMIQKWIQMQIIGLVQSLLTPLAGGLWTAGMSGGFSTGSAFSMAPGSVPAAGGISMPSFAGGISGGITGFATGGVVTGPTLGLVGEGRFNEAVVPLPDGKSIPVDLGGAGNNISTNIVINVNNGQAQSSSSGGASDLGRKMEGAVKQVIVNELRPGGLLSGGRR